MWCLFLIQSRDHSQWDDAEAKDEDKDEDDDEDPEYVCDFIDYTDIIRSQYPEQPVAKLGDIQFLTF